MSKKDEALKLALEALEEINKLSIGENAICLPAEIDTAMDAIREALAEQHEMTNIERHERNVQKFLAEQPAQQQEPVGQLQEEAYGRGQVMWFNKPADQSMLYTSPASKPWVGLTDEDKHYLNEVLNLQGRFPVIDAIEARLKEKNP